MGEDELIDFFVMQVFLRNAHLQFSLQHISQNKIRQSVAAYLNDKLQSILYYNYKTKPCFGQMFGQKIRTCMGFFVKMTGLTVACISRRPTVDCKVCVTILSLHDFNVRTFSHVISRKQAMHVTFIFAEPVFLLVNH